MSNFEISYALYDNILRYKSNIQIRSSTNTTVEPDNEMNDIVLILEQV